MADVILNKLFDVRNGNNATIGTDTYVNATIIGYQNGSGKQKVIDAFCKVGGYQDNIPDPSNPEQTIPNPMSRQQFFNRELTQFIKDRIRHARSVTAIEAIVVDETDLP